MIILLIIYTQTRKTLRLNYTCELHLFFKGKIVMFSLVSDFYVQTVWRVCACVCVFLMSV